MGHLLGGEKNNLLIRDIDGPAMTAASMESCRFAARRSPRGRFWSVVDVRKRLQRVRHPFHQSIHIKQSAQPASAWAQVLNVLDPELSGEPQAPAHAV